MAQRLRARGARRGASLTTRLWLWACRASWGTACTGRWGQAPSGSPADAPGPVPQGACHRPSGARPRPTRGWGLNGCYWSWDPADIIAETPSGRPACALKETASPFSHRKTQVGPGSGLWQTSAVILQGGRESARPSGLPARAGPSCLLPRGMGPTPRRGQGPPQARTAGEQPEPREGPSPVPGHVAPCRGRAGPRGPGPTGRRLRRGGSALTPRHPAPAHLPRSHPGQQPSCSTAQTSGHSARGVPMPRAPARRHAAHSLHCRRRGEEAVPGGRRAPPPAHPLFLVGETHCTETDRGGEERDTGRRRRRWVCPPGPGRLSAPSVLLPLPEARTPLGGRRVFCPPSPGQSCPLWAQVPAPLCLNRGLPEPALLGAASAGRAPDLPDLPHGGGQPPQWRWAARLWALSSRPSCDPCLLSYPGRWAPPHALGGPSGLKWMGGFWGPALRRTLAVAGGQPHFHLFPPAEASQAHRCWGWSWGFQEPGLAAQPRRLLSHWVIHHISL